MSGQRDEMAKSGTTARSTGSGSGSASLSDAFVAVSVGKATTGSRRRVKAPEGSSTMEIRRSTWVAAARAKSVLQPVVEEELGMLNFEIVSSIGSSARYGRISQ
jgi:hypothetical protein